MRLTPKLASTLYRAFARDPDAADAVSISGPPGMQAAVVDGVLSLTGAATAFSQNLALPLTLQGLVNAINTSSGYTATLLAVGAGNTGAIGLLDGVYTGGSINLTRYRSTSWTILDAWAAALVEAKGRIGDMLRQVRLDMAEGEWLDYWLRYTIGGGRNNNEADAGLRARIVSTILAPKCNGFAIEDIVKAATGQTIRIEDIPWLRADGTVDDAVVTRYTLNRFPDGRPAWGAPANGNPVQAAFAVIFPDGETCSQRRQVLEVIHRVKAAGTQPLTYCAAEMLRTNIPAEITNSEDWRTGPFTADFVPCECMGDEAMKVTTPASLGFVETSRQFQVTDGFASLGVRKTGTATAQVRWTTVPQGTTGILSWGDEDIATKTITLNLFNESADWREFSVQLSEPINTAIENSVVNVSIIPVYLTSTIYPVVVVDGMNYPMAAVTFAQLITEPMEAMSFNLATPTGGTLFNDFNSFTAPVESMNFNMAVPGDGTLRVDLQTYQNYPPEGLNFQLATVQSGSLT